MKKMMKVAMFTALTIAVSINASARNTEYKLPIDAAMQAGAADQKIDPAIKLYFADQAHPRVVQSLGSGVTNDKTNSFGKSDEKACNWAFLSGVIDLQKQARERGANSVINIESYYKKVPMSSRTNYECHAGAIIAGVALKGDFVRTK